MEIIVLKEDEIRSCVKMDEEALVEVAKGFTKLAAGEVTLPPIMRINVPEKHGEVDVKSAYIHGLDSFAIKIAAGFFENRLLGLPTGSGMMVLVSADTGRAMAVLLDNGYLTDVRTGIAGAIAARYLAKESVDTAGVIGSGIQARYQMHALRLVREYQRLYVYGIIPEDVAAYRIEMAEALGVEVIAAPDAETVVRESDVVVTTTPATEPYLKADWLHPGLHITCMGSDAEHKQELHADVFGRADIVACDDKQQVFRLGELHHALEAGILTLEDDIVQLGELASGERPGRQNEEQVTLCDLTGVGVQDTQIARLAYSKAKEAGLGLSIGE